MVRMALAAQKAGAVGIRAEGVNDIAQIVAATPLPVIGIRKEHYEGSSVYITPTRREVDEVAHAGAKIIALDATTRPRPRGETLDEVVAHAKSLGLIVMADLAGAADADAAIAAGVDVLNTTLIAASSADIRPDGPNLSAVASLVEDYPDRQIVAEGRYATPDDIQAAFRAGASVVVVGKAVTDAYALARDLVVAADAVLASHPAVAH